MLSKLIGLLLLLVIVSCQSKPKELPPFYQDVEVLLLAHQPQLYQCYKTYLSDQPAPKNGQLDVQWKIYSNSARDIIFTRSFAKSIEVCLIRTLRQISFADLYLGNEVRVVKYTFNFTDGQLDFKPNLNVE